MKKLYAVAVAVCLCVGSSFATWDYFPPKDAGKGEVKFGFTYGIPAEKTAEIDLSLAARYGITQGLEAAITLPFPMSRSYDGNSTDEFAGLASPIVGARYWVSANLGLYLDFTLPVDTRDWMEDFVAMGIGVGAQYSTGLTKELSLGSQIGLTVPFENKLKAAAGMGMVIGAELDYSLGAITPFLGIDASFGLTKPTLDGNDVPFSDAAPFGADLRIGAVYAINAALAADASVKFGLGEGKGGKDNTPIAIDAHFSLNF